MDELIQYCLQSLAFDGNLGFISVTNIRTAVRLQHLPPAQLKPYLALLGCNTSRLRDFVEEFYSSRTAQHQILDDSYHAFVWFLIAQQPSVRIGLIPEGQNSEVFIPAQPKARKKGKDSQEENKPEPASELVPISNAKSSPLSDLLQIYGQRLRIAVDPETCFVAITGSHARPAKLTPMVYASLQLISRAREEGLSVTALGRATGYDQKTCFYLVKQLIELDLVVKLRRGGNSMNFCVHKYFFDRSPIWKAIKDEELKGQELLNVPGDGDAGLTFDPIDVRHLTSLNILRQRLIMLLKNSEDESQPYQNICLKIGFHPKSRTDRRFFISRINELISEGTIEKFYLSSRDPNALQNRLFLRLRIRSQDEMFTTLDDNLIKVADNDEMIEALTMEDTSVKPRSMVTLHRQVIDLVQNSRATGVTLNEISERLDSFEKRILELIITRAERQPIPPHLFDSKVIQVLETYGRERRYRFFTVEGYSELAARDNLKDSESLQGIHALKEVGGFMSIREKDFYLSRDVLLRSLDKFGGAKSMASSGSSKKNTGSSKVFEVTQDDQDNISSSALVKDPVNSISQSNPKKRGRPSINSAEVAVKRPRGRPRKSTAPSASTGPIHTGRDTNPDKNLDLEEGAREKRDSKRKRRDSGMTDSELIDTSFATRVTSTEPTSNVSGTAMGQPQKRKRGRPPKKQKLDSVSSSRPLDDASDKKTTTPELEGNSTPINKCSQEIHEGGISASGFVLPESSILPPTFCSGIQILQDAQNSAMQEELGLDLNLISSLDEIVSGSNSACLFTQPDLHSHAGENDAFAPLVDGYPGSALCGVVQSPQDQSDVPNNTSEIPVTGVSEISGRSFGGDTGIEGRVTTVSDVVTKAQSALSREDSHVIGARSGDAEYDKSNTITGLSDSIQGPQRVISKVVARKAALKSSGGKTNLTALRRETEVVKLLENAGGIINTSANDFMSLFMDLVESIVKSGAAASQPIGSRMDRRTLNYTLERLEEKGMIKTIHTNIQYSTGIRNSKLIYLPSVSEESLRDFLSRENAALGQIKQKNLQQREITIAETNPDSPIAKALKWLHKSDSQEPYHERWHRNHHRVHELFVHGEEVIHSALLLEKQTLSQTYGYLTGKAMRARKLHLHTSSIFSQDNPSAFIVSRKKRIIASAYFERDLPLSVYCTCVLSLAYREDIRVALGKEGEKDVRVESISDDWKHALGIGRSRSRDRIIDLLEYLRSLDIATPLQSTSTATASSSIICDDHGNHPSVFQPVPSDWSTRMPVIHPTYWQFNTTAPLYLLATQEDPLPFCKGISIASEEESMSYWDELKRASLDRKYAIDKVDTVPIGEIPLSQLDQRVMVSLKRSSSWNADYSFSWYQTQYLKGFVDGNSGCTPLQDADGGVERMEKISYVLSAPLEAIRKYFVTQRELSLGNIQRVQKKREQSKATESRIKKSISLAQKGAEAVQNRERTWEVLLKKVHPGPLKGVAASRLRKLRQAYISGGVVQDNNHWTIQITEAIRAAEKCRASRKLFKTYDVGTASFKQQSNSSDARPAGEFSYALDKLIDIQRNMFMERTLPGFAEGSGRVDGKLRKKKVADGATTVRTRRQRFQWNADFDELARDASVIIRSRCRSQKRLDWGALVQVFPAIPRNTVRLRIQTLKEQPGAEAYLSRLENCWHDLWLRKRSTNELPDDNPLDPTGFDLKAHIEYLRKNIDKIAIRVGITTEPEREYTILPKDPRDLSELFDINERGSGTNWEFLFNASSAEESREKLFLDSSFVLETESLPKEHSISDSQSIAESALKMVIGTPNESYDADLAASFLYGIGEKEISIAQENLLSRNVLSKLIKGTNRLIPGRTIKISDTNQYALGGPLSEDVFQDAAQLEESYALEQDKWHNWPSTSSDGDTAAILQLISDNKVDFQFDTTHAQSTRASVEGNSRKVDDDDIELDINVKIRDIVILPKPTHDSAEELIVEPFDSSAHCVTVSGDKASCRRFSDGIIDCSECIEHAEREIGQNNYTQSEKGIAQLIVHYADSRGDIGIETEELKNLLADTCDVLTFTKVLHSLHTSRVPLCYLTGYSQSILVSAKYVRRWTVSLPTPDPALTRVFPRRWVDIRGERVPEVWNAALRAVSGLIHLRPGISQAEIRWRLEAVYDRQEVIEVLSHLVSHNKIRICRYTPFQHERIFCLESVSSNEEKTIFWMSEENHHWFQL